MDADGFRRNSASRVAAAIVGARLSAGGWWVARCPFCEERTGTPDRHGKFGVNAESSVFHCFRCGAKGKLHRAEEDALKARVKAPRKGPPVSPNRAPIGFWSLQGAEDSITLRPALDYLRSRHVGARIIREAQLGACIEGPYASRIVIPLLPSSGATTAAPWLGFVARTWLPPDECDRKYLYPEGMPRGRAIYNEAALTVETEVPVAAVEGALDTYVNWPDAVALLGEASEAQTMRLARCPRPVAVVLDGDAWRKGVALAQRLRFEGQRAGAVVLPPRVDPDEVGETLRDACWQCIERGVVHI